MLEYGYYYVCSSEQTLSRKFESDILRIIMDSYRKYREMYGNRYNFDNPYTTSYFCNLLIDVAKDQFAYPVDPFVLKNMLSIFANDEQIKALFACCDIENLDKRKISKAIRGGDADDIYTALRKYAASLQRKETYKQGKAKIRYVLSRVKQIFLHGK
jgi:hypothetical protein